MIRDSGSSDIARHEGIDQAPVATRHKPDARRVALIVSAVAMLLVLFSFGLALYGIAATGETRQFISHQALIPFASAIYLVLGVMVISRQPKNLIGWLFLSVGALYSLSALAAVITMFGTTLPFRLPQLALDLAVFLGIWIWIPTQMLPTVFVFLLFPDGRLLSPGWRPVVWAGIVGLVLVVLATALHPAPMSGSSLVANPLGLRGSEAVLSVLMTVGSVLLAVGLVGSLVAVVVRFRRSRGIERQQIKWLAYVCILFVILSLATVPMFALAEQTPFLEELGIATSTLAMIAIAVAVTIAIARFQLYDIDVIVNRTLVYGVLTAIIVLIYVLVVGAAGALFQTQSNWLVALLATGLVAVLFNPLRARLQRWTNRLLYGQRDEPFEVLAQLGQRLEDSVAPESIYPSIVEIVAQTLRLPYAAVVVRQGTGYQLVEDYGRLTGEPVVFPLSAQGEEVGRLLIGPRSPGEKLSPADERLLQNIARQAGSVVYDVQLTHELQRSRQQIVTSREEERRRLRRDLHDGLGPSLASLHLEAGVLRRLIHDDPDAAVALVTEMQSDIRTTIEDIRRVVHELRPPALDDLGLVPALNVLATRIGRPDQEVPDGLRIDVLAPDDMPHLAAAVEVAAYRIVQEALANVIHHANARHAIVRLRLDIIPVDVDMASNGQVGTALVIEVEDNGTGFVRGREGGLGLHSMRERAAELGGRCTISGLPGGGTRVEAILPSSGAAT